MEYTYKRQLALKISLLYLNNSANNQNRALN